MKNLVADAVSLIVQMIVHVIIWDFILFNVGRGSLLLVTLGKYPRGRDAELHADRISLTGVLVLVLAWAAIVLCNNILVTHI